MKNSIKFIHKIVYEYCTPFILPMNAPVLPFAKYTFPASEMFTPCPFPMNILLR